MKNVAVIPLRSNSTRFKNKNITDILGTPLFGISANTAMESKVFDEIFIATDTPDLVSDFCDLNGFKIFERSKESASSKAQTEEVLIEIIESGKFEADWVTLIQATCPFQRVEYFRSLQDQIDSNQYHSVITRIKSKRFFINEVISEDFNRSRTQDIDSSYLETGLFWSFKTSHFLKSKKRIINPVGFVDINNGDDVDIDYESDLEIAYPRLKNLILSNRDNFIKREISKKDVDYFDSKVDPDGKTRDFINEVQGRLDFAETEINEVKKFLNEKNSISNNQAHILDIGCGTGVISGEFKKFDTKITGIEPSEIACNHAKERLDNVLCGGYEEYTKKFTNNAFDIIIAFHVIEHVKNPNHLLNEITRILKRGGLAVISTPDFEGPIAKKYGKKFRLYNDPTHISLFGMTGLIKSIESRGLSILKIDQPFLETKFYTKENILRLFADEDVSPPFTGNVMSLYVTK